jgi:hypothetical protein
MRELAVLRLKLGTEARYGNEHHQSVAYASRLNIMLGRAQNVKEPFKMYIIIRDYVVAEIYVFFAEIP